MGGRAGVSQHAQRAHHKGAQDEHLQGAETSPTYSLLQTGEGAQGFQERRDGKVTGPWRAGLLSRVCRMNSPPCFLHR